MLRLFCYDLSSFCLSLFKAIFQLVFKKNNLIILFFNPFGKTYNSEIIILAFDGKNRNCSS